MYLSMLVSVLTGAYGGSAVAASMIREANVMRQRPLAREDHVIYFTDDRISWEDKDGEKFTRLLAQNCMSTSVFGLGIEPGMGVNLRHNVAVAYYHVLSDTEQECQKNGKPMDVYVFSAGHGCTEALLLCMRLSESGQKELDRRRTRWRASNPEAPPREWKFRLRYVAIVDPVKEPRGALRKLYVPKEIHNVFVAIPKSGASGDKKECLRKTYGIDPRGARESDIREYSSPRRWLVRSKEVIKDIAADVSRRTGLTWSYEDY